MRKKRKDWQWRNLNSEETSEEEKKRVSVAKPEQVRKQVRKKRKEWQWRNLNSEETSEEEKKRVAGAKPEQ